MCECGKQYTSLTERQTNKVIESESLVSGVERIEEKKDRKKEKKTTEIKIAYITSKTIVFTGFSKSLFTEASQIISKIDKVFRL